MYPFFRKATISVVLIAICHFVVGCGAHQLHRAQDSFNQAARIEARVSFETLSDDADPLEGTPQALGNYRLALALTNDALEKYDSSLKKDQLYGTALMLKALCQWRIAALERESDAEEIRRIVAGIENLVENQGIKLGTRDRVLLKALPGLHEHELGRLQNDPQKAERLFKSALSTLELALEQVNPPRDHPVQAYIRLSQMRILRAWRWTAYPHRPRDSDELTRWNEAWNRSYETYRKAVAPLMEANRGLRERVKEMDHVFGWDGQ